MSQLGRHQTALEHAQSALILLQEELLSPPGTSTSAVPPKADRIAVLAIAYHNIGVENEFLKKYEQSTLSYRKGVEVAERYLGPKHAITITLKNSLVAAKKMTAANDLKMSRSGKNNKNTESTLGHNKTSKLNGKTAPASPPKEKSENKRNPGDKNVSSLADALAVDLGIDENRFHK